MKYLKMFEEYDIYDKEYRKFIDNSKGVAVKIGDDIITWEDLKTKYRKSIEDFYGNFYEVENALDNLRNIEYFWENGGELYRIVWLDEGEKLNKSNMGYYWVEDPYDLEYIVFMLAPNDVKIFKKDENDKLVRDDNGLWIVDKIIKNTKEPYVVVAHTPPHNVKIPDDYFNNIAEKEIFIKDPKKLKFIDFYKY